LTDVEGEGEIRNVQDEKMSRLVRRQEEMNEIAMVILARTQDWGRNNEIISLTIPTGGGGSPPPTAPEGGAAGRSDNNKEEADSTNVEWRGDPTKSKEGWKQQQASEGGGDWGAYVAEGAGESAGDVSDATDPSIMQELVVGPTTRGSDADGAGVQGDGKPASSRGGISWKKQGMG